MTAHRRNRFILLFVLATAGLALLFCRVPEPAYQGRSLDEWLTDLLLFRGPEGRFPDEAHRQRAWAAQREKAALAVRQIGTRALAGLLDRLRPPPESSWLRDKVQALRNKAQELLDKQSLLRLRLPGWEDCSDQAIQGFRALGPAAAPAVPRLTRLLDHEPTWYAAGLCLEAIGPAALPALAYGLTHTNSGVQAEAVRILTVNGPVLGPAVVPILAAAATNRACLYRHEAMLALGNLVAAARGTTPWLVSLVRDPTNSMAGLAMRVLTEVSDSPEQYLSLFAERLADTNLAAHAAFALTRSGPSGVPPLLRALTNQALAIRNAAMWALDPELRNTGPGRANNPPNYRFSDLSARFPLRFRPADSSILPPGMPEQEGRLLAPWLTRLLDHTNAAVRLEIVAHLRRSGHWGAFGLSRAAADQDEAVRSAAQAALASLDLELRDGAIARGPKNEKKIALVFTAHEYGEGGPTILDELTNHHASASFFFTGHFLAQTQFTALAERVVQDGHYLGAHSDKHLLYCSWGQPAKTLVTRDQLLQDFMDNCAKLSWFDSSVSFPAYFLPPYEHCNLDIAQWADDFGITLLNYTPGTRSAADYTGEADTNFVSSQAILDSIVAREQQDPHGLNGFILLFHLGAGPARADKFHPRFGQLLDYLAAKGYQFVAVDEMFDPRLARQRRETTALALKTSNFARRYGLRAAARPGLAKPPAPQGTN